MKTGIEEAIEAADGQVKLAEILGVTQQAVSLWLQQGYVPNNRVVAIETLFGVARKRLINPLLADLVDIPTDSEGGEV